MIYRAYLNNNKRDVWEKSNCQFTVNTIIIVIVYDQRVKSVFRVFMAQTK